MILHAFRCLDMKTSTLRMLKEKGLEEIYPKVYPAVMQHSTIQTVILMAAAIW